MPKPKTTSPVQIATRQKDGMAIIYMYGIVGQEAEYWLEGTQQQEDITAMALVDALNDLSEDNDIIQLRINSPGGSVYEGEAIVNAIQNCSAEVHTYNDGLAASMAATIWMAGQKRFMGRNAKMMIHAPSNFVFGCALAMREEADKLDKFSEASAESIALLIGMTSEEVSAQFFEDGKDHWITYRDAVEMGLINDDEGYQSAAELPTNVEQLSHLQLMQQFQAKPPQQERQTLFGKVRNWVVPQQTATIPENSEPVTPQELRAAIDAGDITLDQVSQVVADATPAPDPTANLAETIQLAVQAGVEQATTSLNEQIEALQTQVQQLGDKPGAAPAGTLGNADPGSQEVSQVQKDASYFGKMANTGGNPFKNPTQEVTDDLLVG